MAVRDIVIAPDSRLKTRATPVSQVDDAVRALMDDLADTMYEAPGFGLAAPQIGVLQRVIAVDCSPKDEPAELYQMANPEIIWASEELRVAEEGCLSVPDQYAEITRHEAVTVAYRDRNDAPQELHAQDLLAACVQHEIDHLNGVLFYDRLSQLKRNVMLRKARRLKRGRETTS